MKDLVVSPVLLLEGGPRIPSSSSAELKNREGKRVIEDKMGPCADARHPKVRKIL